MGEAKASGNLGNTLKMLGRFEEAIQFCEKHLLISRAEHDKVNKSKFLKVARMKLRCTEHAAMYETLF